VVGVDSQFLRRTRFADAWLAHKHGEPALPQRDICEHCLQLPQLVSTSDEGRFNHPSWHVRPAGHLRCGGNREARQRLQGTSYPASVDAKLGSNSPDTLAPTPQLTDVV
jgi:hypothetical protein